MNRRWIVLAAVTALLLVACGGGEAGGAGAPMPSMSMSHGMGSGDSGGTSGDCRAVEGGQVTITAEALAFDTDCLEAPADEPFVITLDNRDSAPHNVKIEDAQGGVMFDGENVTQGSIDYEVPALAAGEYTFHCHVHPDMAGTLLVS